MNTCEACTHKSNVNVHLLNCMLCLLKSKELPVALTTNSFHIIKSPFHCNFRRNFSFATLNTQKLQRFKVSIPSSKDNGVKRVKVTSHASAGYTGLIGFIN